MIQNFSGLVLRDYLFSDPENFPIDPNIVSVNQYGQEETLLDYIDRVLSSHDVVRKYNTDSIREVRDIIENEFGGKRARELQ